MSLDFRDDTAPGISLTSSDSAGRPHDCLQMVGRLADCLLAGTTGKLRTGLSGTRTENNAQRCIHVIFAKPTAAHCARRLSSCPGRSWV